MPKPRTRPYDTANYLTTVEHIAGYLEIVLEEGDSELIAAALGMTLTAKPARASSSSRSHAKTAKRSRAAAIRRIDTAGTVP